MRHLTGLIAASVVFAAATAADAAHVEFLSNYDTEYDALCASSPGTANPYNTGVYACEYAVAVARNGDDNPYTDRKYEDWELGIVKDHYKYRDPTSNSAADGIEWEDDFGDWYYNRHEFSLEYINNTLTFSIDNAEVYYEIGDLSGAGTMYIRAQAKVMNNWWEYTWLKNMQLTQDGTPTELLPVLGGDKYADYLAISEFQWGEDWTLTGDIFLAADNDYPEYKPSVQFRLTDIGGGSQEAEATAVPEPTPLMLLGGGLLLLAGLRRMRDRQARLTTA